MKKMASGPFSDTEGEVFLAVLGADNFRVGMQGLQLQGITAA